MNPHVLLGGVLFACAAIAGMVAAWFVCARVSGFADGPTPGTPPVTALAWGAALVGGIAGAHADPTRLGIVAVVCLAFVAVWYCDVARGIVPDVFTLGPLLLFVVLAFVWHDPRAVVSAAIVFVPFAGAALLSRGLGMGWGDVKLAALSGALLGASNALLACAVAAFAAVAQARFSPPAEGRPIAFAPYIIAANALFTAWTSLA